MVIISKKRLMILSSILCMSVFLCNFVINNQNNDNNILNNKKERYSSVETMTLPVTNKVIVIDAGHGKPDEGAESSNRNIGSRNKLKNCIKTPKFVGTIWKYSDTNKE